MHVEPTLLFMGKGSEMRCLPGALWKSSPFDAGCDPAVHSTRSACSSCIWIGMASPADGNGIVSILN